MKWLYKVTNNISGKLYIGVSIDPERRWNQHRTLNTRASALKDAIKKYGSDNFSFTLLCCGGDTYIDDLEVKAIQLYNTQVPNGYNITLGGDGANLTYWDDDWNSLLGTMTDKALAKKLDISDGVVSSRRNGLGIPSFAEANKIDWEKYDDLLGTSHDHVIAERIGVSSSSVGNRRRELDIPKYTICKDYNITEDIKSSMGVLSDRAVSEKFNIPFYVVREYRLENGIKGAKQGSWVTEREWTDYELSKVKDTSITTEDLTHILGISRNTVQSKRKSLGIKFDRKFKTPKYPLTEELIAELEDTSLTYKYFKTKYGMSSCTLTRKRKNLEELRSDK